MKGLLSTTASRAWMGVVAVGVVVVVLVVGLALIPRMSAGQGVIDASSPATSDAAVAGLEGGTSVLSEYVDLVDPLMTRRGESNRELRRLVTMIKRRTGVSAVRARALLRREAPHTEALLRAAPFSGIAAERSRLTRYLAKTLNITPEELEDELARSFPRIYQTLSELPDVTSGWYDVPGTETLTRFDGTRVKTMAQVRDYVRDDVVGTVAAQQGRLDSLGGSGGVGFLPWMLLALGVGLIAFGLVHARWSAAHPSGRVAWGAIVAVGVFVMLLVGALQLVPRLIGGEKAVAKLEPAFDAQRVIGLRAGSDSIVQAVRFGDPMMTPAGGAAAEVPKLVTFVSGRAGVSEQDVRRQLRDTAPRTMALFEAIPLSAVAAEEPHLVAVLSHKLGISGDRLVHRLRRRTPGLAQALLAAGPATIGWTSIPGAKGLKSFDLETPVRTAPDFVSYLDRDVVPIFESQEAHVDTLASTWPPLSSIAWLVLAIGALLAIYGTAMLFLATKPAQRR